MRGAGGKTSIAQSYRFLRSVMNAAVREGAISRNPCTIPGAGADRAKERPIATPAQIVALVDAITPRYRAAVLIAAWGGLRRGEIVGLHREDVDLAAGTVRVRRSRAELLESKVACDKDPKSEAGKRTVALPPHILPVLAEHLDLWAGDERVFVGRTGEPMRGDAIRQAFTAPAPRSAWTTSASTTSATPAKPSPPQPASPSRTSRSASDTPLMPLRFATFMPCRAATTPSVKLYQYWPAMGTSPRCRS
jgi:integrase